VRSGQWKGWALDQLMGTDVWGKTLGIVGFGRIGRAMARRARGFRMRVVYHSRERAPADVERELAAEFVPFEQVLAQSDFISLHVPLRPETRHLIGARELARMKRTAFVINASRGPVVDEAALAGALEAGQIAGAGLDVYEREPEVTEGLRRPNVVLLPHLGSASVETRTRMAVMAAENVVAYFEHRKPPNILNPEALEMITA
jgi:glyoxylate reductase